MECLACGTLPPVYFGDCFTSEVLAQFCASHRYRIVIVTDKHVKGYYGSAIKNYFLSHNIPTDTIVITPGEKAKTRATKALIEDTLFTLGCGRDTVLMAFGGGVVTDMVGFVAATYCRGIPVIYIPTSLLAMVDAAIGGKTGINTPYGKNTLGTFTQPKAIFINTAFLNTLPNKDYIAAFSEVIKHGLIEDEAYCYLLAKEVDGVKERNPLLLEKIIRRSCEIKSAIVVSDEKENKKREILNFGHTIGHAVEIASDYSLSHGEAVAIGMVLEGDLSQRMGLLTKKDMHFIKNLLEAYGLPSTLPQGLSKESIRIHLKRDKKVRNNELRCVLLTALGKVLCEKGLYAHVVDEHALLPP